ncbi:MAG: hypothetical protein OXK74_08915 [Gemmatimonadota bacterium]|nr:hypothetical protein [Gemmatimonadota bacterium]
MSETIHYVPFYVEGLKERPNPAGVVCGKYYRGFGATHSPGRVTCRRCKATGAFRHAAANLGIAQDSPPLSSITTEF